ncbi:DUF5684 domain-containing protein [Microbacterium trichothecenolyticum]|uniref:Large exoprotein n=1 Tax=Microbacterium trichothecenolyticum TaxID=69370 RepID=A0ABU0TT22_MICTR|nr:DUF5684 domain-containing protein [Microbacterium trichothecenolyticum]MDQ1122811.1 hypothetical protein [Microbacterium trichothecenolyticum]
MHIISSFTYSEYGTTTGAEAVFGVVFFVFAVVLSLAGYLIGSFLLMKVFEQAGVEGKWRAWVPVYNVMVFAKLGDITPWAIVFVIVAWVIPIVNFLAVPAMFVLVIMASVRINAKFGRDWPILFLYILGSLGMWIWLGILAFSGNRWNPAAASPSPWASSFLADKTFWEGIPAQPAQNVAAPSAGYGADAPPAPGYAPPAAPPAPGYAPPAAPPSGGPTPPPPAGPQV